MKKETIYWRPDYKYKILYWEKYHQNLVKEIRFQTDKQFEKYKLKSLGNALERYHVSIEIFDINKNKPWGGWVKLDIWPIDFK